MAGINSVLMGEIFDIPKQERKSYIEHHRKLDDLGRRLEVAEWRFDHAAESRTVGMSGSSEVRLTMPLRANLNPALLERILNVLERNRKPNVHPHRKTNDLGRRFKVAERPVDHLNQISRAD